MQILFPEEYVGNHLSLDDSKDLFRPKITEKSIEIKCNIFNDFSPIFWYVIKYFESQTLDGAENKNIKSLIQTTAFYNLNFRFTYNSFI